ncbi:MAG TPA: elongation factor P [Rickettsiales bacterium]|nr:elongation factor P [Rickettsiales bacterium]
MKIDGSAIRPGMVLEYNNRLVLVTNIKIGTPGNLRAFNQVEMKDIKTGTKTNYRFGSDEKVERVQLEQKEHQYLYDEGDMLVFMNNENYEQIHLNKELVGESIAFLQENMNVMIESYEGEALSVALPETVIMEIVETEPVVKGQTASSSYKPAKLENGARVMVPPFIETGTRIVVNTRDVAYVERAK